MNKAHAGLAILIVLISTMVHSSEQSEIRITSPKVFYEFGGIVNAVHAGTDTINNQWAQRFGGTFDIQSHSTENFSVFFGMGGVFWHAIPEIDVDPTTLVFLGDAIITKAYGSYKFGDPDLPIADVKFGYFPIKYSFSKNLGEYLFRTGTYPNYIVTGNALTTVNTARTGVLGFSVDHTIGEIFSHSLFFTSEKQSYPLHDFSLAYLAKFYLKFFSIGGGLKLNRIIPITPSYTTPSLRENTYFSYQGSDYTFNSEYYYHLADGAKHDSSSVSTEQWQAEVEMWENIGAMVDSLYLFWEPDSNASQRPEYNTYSFKGINALMFASLDLNLLTGLEQEDIGEFNLYSEAVLMGVANKPVFYENRLERTAIMFGLNLPTFGILNVLNVELEYFPNKFVNGYSYAKYYHAPLPDFDYHTKEGYNPDDWSSDDLKWSIYLSRNIFGGITLEAQIASDHLRGRRGNRVVSEQPILVDKNHWYYMFKLQAAF